MAKNFKSYVLGALAVAAVALSGCSKNDAGMKEIGNKDFSVTLTGANTKTTNDGLATLWAANDAINLFHNQAGESEPVYLNDGKFTTSEAGATATFSGTLAEEIDESKAYNWYAFYPYTSQVETPANTSKGYVTVGSGAKLTQTQNGNNSTAHISGKNYPVAGVLSKIPGSENPVIQMKHLSSLVAVTVENQTDAPITVSSISMTADGVDIIGTYYIDFTQDPAVFTPSGDTYVSSTAVLVVNDGEEIAPKESAKFYFAVKPFVVNEGDMLTLMVSGSNGPEEKIISAEKNYEFKSGKIKNIKFVYDVTEASYDFTTVAELNAIAAEVGNTPASKFGKLTDAVVSFVPNTGVAIITDGTGSVTYFKSSHGLKQGQTYTGDVNVTVLNYNDLYSEITTIDAAFEGEGAVVEPASITIADLIGNYTTYQNDYVKVDELEVTAIDGKNISVTDGTNSYIVYLNSGTAPCVVSDKISVVGTVTKFGTTEEIKAWKAADITVTSHTATKHKVTFSQPTDGSGSFVVKDGSTTISSGDEVMEGNTVTIVATPATGFKFSSWSVTGATPENNSAASTTFTMGSEDVTIAATFMEEGATDWSLVETSNVLMKKENGTNAYEHTVNLRPAIKIGTGSLGGSYKISLPAGTTKLHLHAVAWKGVTGLSLNVTGATATPSSIALTANDAITGTPTAWTITNPADYYFVINFSNIVTDTEITLTTSIAKRFILWGVNTE
jgi:hypothetical protein